MIRGQVRSSALVKGLTIVSLMLLSLSHTRRAAAFTILNVLYAAPGGLTSGACDTWGNACDLQYALTVAAGDFVDDQIWVKEGTYKPSSGTDQYAYFALQDGVGLYGGFVGTEAALGDRDPIANPTILSGDLKGDDGSGFTNYSDNSEYVVLGSGVNNSAVLDGFTVEDGNAVDYNSGIESGGGIHLTNSSPVLRNLVLQANYALFSGGGLSSVGGDPQLTNVAFLLNYATSEGGGMQTDGNPHLNQVTFSSNSAGGLAAGNHFGGGMYMFGGAPVLTDVSFAGNSAWNGGGMYADASDPALTRVTFDSNPAGYGGGMFNLGGSATLVDVTFNNNGTLSASSFGGGMYNEGSSPWLTDVTFSLNKAEASGGAMYNSATNGQTSSPTLTDVTFSGNSAAGTGEGGAMYNYASGSGSVSSPVLHNVTFSGNTAYHGLAMANITADVGSSWPTVSDAIFWDLATGDEVQNNTGSITIDHSVLKGGCGVIAGATCGAGNLSTDPMLGALWYYGGFTKTLPLQAGSSAIDTGTNTGCPALDQRDIPRWQGLRCDMGAYEAIDPTVERVLPTDGATACLTPRIGLTVELNDLMRTGGSFDASTVTLALDASDILSAARISQNEDFPASLATLIYNPASALSAGAHEVIFTYPTANGTMQRVWDFTAAAITCTAAAPQLPSLPGPTIITPSNPQAPTSPGGVPTSRNPISP